MFIKISQNLHGNTCARVSFLMKLQAAPATLLKKEALAQVFSYEFHEIFKSTCFYRTLPMTASIQRREYAGLQSDFRSAYYAAFIRKISSKTDPRSSSKRKRKVMLELEIIKQHKQSCHLFEFFILNNKA